MMVQYEVEFVELPLVTEERIELAESETDDNNVQDTGEAVHINFNAHEQAQKAGQKILVLVHWRS